MKKILIYVVAVLSIAAIFGIAGTFFGYYLANSNEPAVVVYNLTNDFVPEVKIESGDGEIYNIGRLSPNDSHRLKISGRDKTAWVVITTNDGERRESQRLYMTSQGILFAMITDSGIKVDYQL